MDRQHVYFENNDGMRLAGILDRPTGRTPRGYVLFAHCFSGTDDTNAAINIGKALCGEGFGVLCFDFTGRGQQEDESAGTAFASSVADLVAAARFLQNNYAAPVILLGHSLGGAALLEAAHEIPSVRALSTIGVPADSAHVTHLFDGERATIEREGEAVVVQGFGQPFRVRKQLLDDLESVGWKQRVHALGHPLLILHSPADKMVAIDSAAQLFDAARHPKSFVSLDRADHLLSQDQDSRYVGVLLAAWAAKYLDPDKTGEVDYDEPVIARLGATGLRTEMEAGGLPLIADEPKNVGGTATAPTPYGYLSAALAACTAMTLRMYAKHQNIDLRAVEVSVRHDKIHAKDCQECDSRAGRVDHFWADVRLEGDLSAEQRQRLLMIAEICPVHRTLHSEVDIQTRLVEDGERPRLDDR